MIQRHTLLSALALLVVGCATNDGIHVGKEADSEIRASLAESTVRQSVLLDGNRAYWIGPTALVEEKKALLDALGAAPALGLLPDSKGSMMTLNGVPPEEVIGFRHTSEMLDLGLETGGFARVLRFGGEEAHYEAWVQVGRDLKFTSVKSTPALEAAWRAFAQGAARRCEEMGASPYARQFRGWPLEPNLGAVTIVVDDSSGEQVR